MNNETGLLQLELTIRLERMEAMIAEMRMDVAAIGSVLIRQCDAGKALGMHPNSIPNNKKIAKYTEIGHRRTYIEIRDVRVIEQTKRRKRSSK